MSDLLLEIGCEELPARDIDPAVDFLQTQMASELAAFNLSYGAVQAFGTPRRLVLVVRDLANKQPDSTLEVLGPKVELAFTAEGQLTAVGNGFLNARGLTPEIAYQKQTPKGNVIAAMVNQRGKHSKELLVGLLEVLITRIPFAKTMRWDASGVQFARPVRWLLCLLGEEILPIRFGLLTSDRVTCGHRFLSPEFKPVKNAQDYLAGLPKRFVMLDAEDRKAIIAQEAQRLCEGLGGYYKPDAALLDTVKNLVEYPWPLLGHFDDCFLRIPKEVLISEMREHQKYFACEQQETGKLLPAFVVVAGSKPHDSEEVARGHARVLRARFEDGAFYYETDKQTSLVQRIPLLSVLVFQRELGSMLDKTNRLEALVAGMAQELTDCTDADRACALRAAYLCKGDLLTGVVGEFPELQGTMGRIYADLSGETQEVADAIEQHYWPKGAYDQLPVSKASALLAIADRLDTLVGIIGIGRAPKGSADPFGLRRAGIGICRILMHHQLHLSLTKMITHAAQLYAQQLNLPIQQVVEQTKEFILARCRGVLLEMANTQGEAESTLVIDGAMSASSEDIADLVVRVQALVNMRQQDAAVFDTLCATLKRAGNIVNKAGTFPAAPAAVLQHNSEVALSQAIDTIADVKETDYASLLAQVASLKPILDQFFTDVMVMVDEEQLRYARLGLLQRLTSLAKQVADFTKM